MFPISRLEIIPEIMVQRKLEHISEHRSLDIQREAPTLTISKGDPVETHLPTVHVAIYIYRRVRQAFLDEVVTRGEPETPFPSHVDLALHIQRMHHIMRVFNRVNQTVISQIVIDAVRERIIERKGPFPPIVFRF